MYPPTNAPALDTRLQSIRKTTVAFASLFKNIPFIKYNEDGTEQERIKVPIIYGNKEKYVKRIDIPNEKVQITLPRIEYGLINMEYDSSRKTSQSNKIIGCSGNGSAYVNSPLPYNFNFELVLYTRNIEDANQIMEYILPFFIPDYNIKINMVPEVGIIKNIPITFTGDSEDEDSTGAFDNPIRSVFRTLTFVARSFIFQSPKYYKPILTATTNINIIKSAVSIHMLSGTGIFVPGEIVFQGTSYNRATVKASVVDWNTLTNVLTINPLFGSFISNTSIQNINITSQYIVDYVDDSSLVYSSTIVPVPNTYPAVEPYDYNITEIDYSS
jgi:hypothetical protein